MPSTEPSCPNKSDLNLAKIISSFHISENRESQSGYKLTHSPQDMQPAIFVNKQLVKEKQICLEME